MRVLFVDLGDTRGELNEPLGIECISSRIIRELHIQVDLLWYGIDKPNFEQFLNYDLIGLSMNIGTMNRFEAIHEYLNEKKPEIPLVLGGCIPTFAYDQLLADYKNIICSYGEGEDSIFELVRFFNEGDKTICGKLQDIPNIAFELDGKIVITPNRPVDLSHQIPIVRNDRILNAIYKKHGIVRIEGSRGCSWNRCSFCCVNAKYADPSWRPFPTAKIISELQELSTKGFLSPYFTDEDFFGQDYKRSISLAKQIIELKKNGLINPRMNFFISILASDAVSSAGQEALKIWKEAGLREVFLGIESLEQEQLKRYCKKANTDTNKKAIEFVNRIGLQIDSGYILFDPQITYEALGENIKYIQSLKINKLDSRSLKRLRLQPMTAISNSMSETIVEKLDVNNLEYPYSFQDVRVAKVYKAYKAWEDLALTEVWTIQAVSRGEIDEEIRVQLKTVLSLIRNVDFDVLKEIYYHCVDTNNASWYIPKAFFRRRSIFIKMGLKIVYTYF